VLHTRDHQGKFAEDYVRVIASAAGLLIYSDDLDRDGIDLGFRYPDRVGMISSPAVEVQVKSWSQPRSVGGNWVFDGLNERQFNKLAGHEFLVPRYLVLVVVPPDMADYTAFETDGIWLRQLAFWRSLANEAPIKEPDRSRRRKVTVPISNVLTVRTLLTLIHPELTR
jgi:hypothetical protein